MSRLLVTQYQAEVEKIIRYGGSKKETSRFSSKTIALFPSLLAILPITSIKRISTSATLIVCTRGLIKPLRKPILKKERLKIRLLSMVCIPASFAGHRTGWDRMELLLSSLIDRLSTLKPLMVFASVLSENLITFILSIPNQM